MGAYREVRDRKKRRVTKLCDVYMYFVTPIRLLRGVWKLYHTLCGLRA